MAQVVEIKQVLSKLKKKLTESNPARSKEKTLKISAPKPVV